MTQAARSLESGAPNRARPVPTLPPTPRERIMSAPEWQVIMVQGYPFIGPMRWGWCMGHAAGGGGARGSRGGGRFESAAGRWHWRPRSMKGLLHARCPCEHTVTERTRATVALEATRASIRARHAEPI